jgi:hypothetical protein
MLKNITLVGFLFLLVTAIGCKQDPLPKPKAHLRLDYTQASYMGFESPCPFTFDFNGNTSCRRRSETE